MKKRNRKLPENRRWTPREIVDRLHPPAKRREIITLALMSGLIRRVK